MKHKCHDDGKKHIIISEEDMLKVLNQLKHDHALLFEKLIKEWDKKHYCGLQLRDIFFTFYIQFANDLIHWLMRGYHKDDPHNTVEEHLYRILQSICYEFGIRLELDKNKVAVNLH